MDDVLRPEAARHYATLTHIAFENGAIEWDVLQERLDYLRELLGDPDPEEGGSDKSPPTGSDHERPHTAEASTEGAPEPAAAPGAHARSNNDVIVTHFIPAGAIGHLKKWDFHKGDVDPYPSVPHGHWEGKPFPKLDPYLGWVCEAKQRQARRLSKSDTRALWNNDRFRDFAAGALVHFIAEHPWHEFRVSHPQRLPRRYR